MKNRPQHGSSRPKHRDDIRFTGIEEPGESIRESIRDLGGVVEILCRKYPRGKRDFVYTPKQATLSKRLECSTQFNGVDIRQILREYPWVQYIPSWVISNPILDPMEDVTKIRMLGD